MNHQRLTFTIEFSADVPQDKLYALEEKLGQIEGVETDLREPKDLFALALLAVAIPQAIKIAGDMVGESGTVQELAKTIYDWRHPAKDRGKLKELEIKKPSTLPTDSLGSSERVELREFLAKRFSLEELKTLAFDLSVEYESFPHETNEIFSREFIKYFEKRDNLSHLLEGILKRRESKFIAELLAKNISSGDSFRSTSLTMIRPDGTRIDLSGLNPEEIEKIILALK